ncbi:hypothetical protein ACWGTO_17260 [Mesorhizobium sp. PL10]
MKAYRVETMDGDVVQESQETQASTPFGAAEKVIGRKVTLRGDAGKWIRVVDLTDRVPTRRRPSTYEYRALAR